MATTATSPGDRYTVISADCHAGGELHGYRSYLDAEYRDEFDAWAAVYEIPYDDLKGPNGSRLRPRYDAVYEPIWRACEDVGLPVHSHSGSAVPDYGDGPVDNVMFLVEVTWWANRNLWHLVFGGVLERHPDLHVVFTEQGTAWVPERLATLDYFYGRMAASSGSQEEVWGREV